MENTPTNLPGKDTPVQKATQAPKEVFLPKKEEEKSEKNIATKVFAVIGLAGILALLSFGIVKLAPSTFSFLSSTATSLSTKLIPKGNLFTGPLSLTSNKTSLNSGDSFTLNWTKNTDEEGSYVISYPCTNGFHLEAPQESEKMILTCNTQYSFGGDTTALDLIAFSLQNLNVEVPVTLDFTKKDSEEITYTTKFVISVKNPSLLDNKDATTTPSVVPVISSVPTKTTPPLAVRPARTNSVTPRTSITTTKTVPTENINGKSDLIVRVLETGVVNKRTNAFTPKSEIKITEKAAVRFVVENIGTKRSGVWTFESKLPTLRNYTFKSGNQMWLMPGDKVEFVLGFDEFHDVPTLSFSITVDPEGYEDELKENNNIGYVSIDIKQ